MFVSIQKTADSFILHWIIYFILFFCTSKFFSHQNIIKNNYITVFVAQQTEWCNCFVKSLDEFIKMKINIKEMQCKKWKYLDCLLGGCKI